MALAHVLLALVVALVARPAAVALWRWWRRRARRVRLVEQVPGPIALPLLGSMIMFLGVKREELFAAFNKETRRYLPTMRVWKGTTPEIHLTRAEDIEIILSSTVHIDKSSSYNLSHAWLGDGLLTSTGKKWHAHRKLITPTFHFRILDSFVGVFAEKSQTLVEVLQKELDNAQDFDMYPYVAQCALDIICETAMGTQINAQRNAQSEYVNAIYDASEGIVQRNLRPWFYPNCIFSRSRRGKVYNKDVSILHGFTKKIIKERRSAIGNKKDLPEKSENDAIGVKRRLAFLDLLLQMSSEGANLTDEDIREEVDTFMFAGHDTTSAGICWVLFLLGSHPDVQKKAMEELEEIFQGSDRAPTMQDLVQMKYLERVIKETLRLYPSVPLIGRNVKEDVQVGKYAIPAGTDIAFPIYFVHRNPEYFPNPEKFDPDNFLPERVQGRHPYAYIPFSAGSRNCIGQKFAMLEEKSVVSTLLRSYAFTAVDREEDVKLNSEIILRPSHGVRLRIARRAPV